MNSYTAAFSDGERLANGVGGTPYQHFEAPDHWTAASLAKGFAELHGYDIACIDCAQESLGGIDLGSAPSVTDHSALRQAGFRL